MKAERDLLQARVKSINSILGDNAKQRELCRSQLLSILSTSTMNKCQQLIGKVSELRFLKVRERQINKFNRLLLKKEGNITWLVPASTPVNRTNPQADNTNPQGASNVPLRQLVPRQTGLIPRHSGLLPKPSRQLVIPRQTVLTLREIALSPQAGSSQADNTSLQAISMASQAFSNFQAGSQLVNNNRQAVSSSFQVGRQVVSTDSWGGASAGWFLGK